VDGPSTTIDVLGSGQPLLLVVGLGGTMDMWGPLRAKWTR